MRFYKITLTKQVYREKWEEVNGKREIVKSFLVDYSSETKNFYVSEQSALKANGGLSNSDVLRKNKKTEIIASTTRGVDEIINLTWQVKEIEVSNDKIIKFVSGNMLVEENGKSFIVVTDKELER